MPRPLMYLAAHYVKEGILQGPLSFTVQDSDTSRPARLNFSLGYSLSSHGTFFAY